MLCESRIYGDVKKFQRRRLGGIIAAVAGCRVILDWEEHQFGEGTSHVYVVLARLVASLLKFGGRLPRVVFMDNACALEILIIIVQRKGQGRVVL